MSRWSAFLLSAVVLSLVGASRPGGLGDVTEIRVFDHETHTRVVVELSRATDFKVGVLSGPPRLYIDIHDTWIHDELAAPQDRPGDVPVRRVRGGQNTRERARIVLDLDRGGRTHRTFSLQEPFRIVTYVFVAETPDVAAAPLDGFDVRPVRRIALDAGHGGKDPGAVGHGRLREKDVTLRIARELRTELERQGFQVVMTRTKDRYLPLAERTAIANRAKADLFLSIHANAAPSRRVAGVETYLLDTRYDKQTARVAARENGTTVGELTQLQKILASLRLGYQERFAARLAETLHGSMVEGLRRHYGPVQDLGVKRGPFMVLFQADMPAILLEVGFLTNRTEAKRLATRDFARRVARSLAQGVVRYRDAHARSVIAGR